jgi:hypothetical protein
VFYSGICFNLMTCVSYTFDCFRSCSTHVQLRGGNGGNYWWSWAVPAYILVRLKSVITTPVPIKCGSLFYAPFVIFCKPEFLVSCQTGVLAPTWVAVYPQGSWYLVIEPLPSTSTILTLCLTSQGSNHLPMPVYFTFCWRSFLVVL